MSTNVSDHSERFTLSRPILLHALSPLHADTAQAAEVIDLPSPRIKATGIPSLPGSSIKGVLPDAGRAGRNRHFGGGLFLAAPENAAPDRSEPAALDPGTAARHG
jgi:CRISPR-associated protein Cmr4